MKHFFAPSSKVKMESWSVIKEMRVHWNPDHKRAPERRILWHCKKSLKNLVSFVLKHDFSSWDFLGHFSLHRIQSLANLKFKPNRLFVYKEQRLKDFSASGFKYYFNRELVCATNFVGGKTGGMNKVRDRVLPMALTINHGGSERGTERRKLWSKASIKDEKQWYTSFSMNDSKGREGES